MPTYEYVCLSCNTRIEVVQSFSDDSLTVCDDCSGELRKVFSPVGVVFKGSGFYRNDSRNERRSSGSSGSSDKGTSAEKATTKSGDGASDKSSTTSSEKSTSSGSDKSSGTSTSKQPASAS